MSVVFINLGERGLSLFLLLVLLFCWLIFVEMLTIGVYTFFS